MRQIRRKNTPGTAPMGVPRLRALEDEVATLRAENQRLRELDRRKDDMIATVTHELRTPLTSIHAFSEILHTHPELDVDQRDKFLEIIIKESERLSRLIHQVLDLSKIESDHADWHITPVDLRRVIEETATVSSQLFERKGVRLALRLPETAPPVAADHDRLTQVLLNLLANAARFSPPESGLVEIVLREEPGALRVDVRDNGPGISPEHQHLIFEKFRQAGRCAQGTGLGLPISREIITRLGGRLWVESEPGCGAMFSFTLPVSG